MLVVAGAPAALSSVVVGFLVYLVIRYGPVISRIFEVRPVFLPLRVTPEDRASRSASRPRTGCGWRAPTWRGGARSGSGVLVFCHEYLSDRWSYLPYLDSSARPRLRHLHLRLPQPRRERRSIPATRRSSGRPTTRCATSGPPWPICDRDPITTRRASASSASAGADRRRWSRPPSEPDVWGVVTDGAFPTHGTMTAYILRWAEIYVRSKLFLAVVPRWVYAFLGWVEPPPLRAPAELPVPRHRDRGPPALAAALAA